ncbi:prepilin-type N-terminal cleavage/methylation domain-containing protein [Nocardioides sp. GY 10113]|uniref:PulJ/GspJ family protein n=1 Tax=Nocardioides sp. GY 10113 TaxID=2569761 RepID=UPI0010A906F2|nr:prepilin-type N-terminal cleavage/methylation domain-containing protein [Nocardioides sp. GY 10113]TIC88841.1 prepilin-type N-terminal cleavage/methylation domain-containing protein [Nocardioides sp. GY 10113]
MRVNQAAGDDGFTLVELVMAVAILGVVMVALTGVVLQHLKVTAATEARLNESSDQQLVSAYWQGDVSSLGVRTPVDATDPLSPRQSVWTGGTGPGSVPPDCGSGLVGDLVIGFAWNVYPVGAADPLDAWDASLEAAVYVTEQVGGQYLLSRVRCHGASTERHVVARHLRAAPTVACADAAGSPVGCAAATPPRTLAITLDVRDADGTGTGGYTATLTAQRRQA